MISDKLPIKIMFMHCISNNYKNDFDLIADKLPIKNKKLL